MYYKMNIIFVGIGSEYEKKASGIQRMFINLKFYKASNWHDHYIDTFYGFC